MSQPLNIIHFSDLHFGKIDQNVLSKLKIFLEKSNNKITHYILTGDLTQRARSHEFISAKEFLHTLNKPLFLVPGNHDIPLYNLYQRFFSPYKKFLKFFKPHSQNFYEDEQIAIFGLWTTNYLTVSKGRINQRDIRLMKDKFQQVSPGKIRIIASHHPVFSEVHPMSKRAKEEVLTLKPHLILSGHEHHAAVRYLGQNSKLPLCISSGTSTSTRVRDQSNGFNFISINEGEVSIDLYEFDSEKNDFISTKNFRTKMMEDT